MLTKSVFWIVSTIWLPVLFVFPAVAGANSHTTVARFEKPAATALDVFDDFQPPDERGPYEVGVTTTYLTDTSRWEDQDEMYRTLPLEIWYPASGDDAPVNTVEDMIGEVPKWGLNELKLYYEDSLDELLSMTTSARRDAPPLTEEGPFPVLLFSHGLTAIRFQNFTLCEHLASHGFIVVAPDHFGNAVFTNVPGDDVIIFEPLSLITGLVDRPLDVNFVYQSLLNGGRDRFMPFELPLDLDTFAVVGHSYGGLTAMLAGPIYDYIDAIVPLNPFFLDFYPPWFTKPVLMLQSEMDEVVGMVNDAARGAFNKMNSDRKIHLFLYAGSHFSATDACRLFPPKMIYPSMGCGSPERIDFVLANQIALSYITAFLKSVLLGDDRYDEYLLANHFPDNIELTTVWPE
ncbi:MAG: hypothetical protein GX444_21420 [Myxococcales bacterium]|nr:hypothetical protein [Myxococcales bacterium]